MRSRGLLGSLASMLALVGLNFGSPAEVEPAPVTIPRPGEALAPPRRRLGGGCGLEFRDDPETLRRANTLDSDVWDTIRTTRARDKRSRVAKTRALNGAAGREIRAARERWLDLRPEARPYMRGGS